MIHIKSLNTYIINLVNIFFEKKFSLVIIINVLTIKNMLSESIVINM